MDSDVPDSPNRATPRLRAGPTSQPPAGSKRPAIDPADASDAAGPAAAELRGRTKFVPMPLPKRRKHALPDEGPTEPSASSSSARPQNFGQEAFKDVVTGFFLDGKLSGRDVALTARAGQNSGASDVSQLAKAGAGGKHPQNACRDLMRQLLKTTSMPELYWQEIPVWDAETGQQEVASMPFLLPHQVLAAIGDRLNLLALDASKAPQIWTQFSQQCHKLGLDPSSTIPIGFHGDGVPYTKKHSLELLSWNILGDAVGDRCPFTGISKSYTCKCGCLGRCTWDAVLAVFAWSMRALCCGVHPAVDPNGQPLQGHAAALAGQPMVKAVLCQIRGDWPFLKQLFSVPGHANHRICWQCCADKSAGPTSYKQVGLNAAWRQNRLASRDFFRILEAQGLTPSPLFGAPGVALEHVVLDWLHIVDLGIAQDLIGNLFHECVLGGLPGANKKERLLVLWTKLRQFYEAHKTPVRLGELTLEMFEQSGKSPKLRSKGGECRHLVPFAASLAAELAHLGEHWARIHNCMRLLFDCAKHAACEPFQPQELARDCRKLCVLWKCLADEAERKGDMASWKQKPKVHLFQELCEYKAVMFGSPELFWTYMDESFCGYLAKAAKRRGGHVQYSTVPERLLTKYRAMRGQ